MAIFDGTYVSENVFAGDVVDTENRRNLYRVIIGAQGVAHAGRLNDLDNQIRTKNNEIRDVRARMQPHMPPGTTVEDFIALPEDATISEKILAKEQELQAVQRAAQLQQKQGLTAAAVPTFPASFAETLGKTLENLGAGAEKLVADHISQHQMRTHGETWLRDGLPFVVDESCPFCGQSLVGVDLIQVYKTFFSNEYHALRSEVMKLSAQVEGVLAERVSAAIEQTLLQNSNNAEFWQQYCDFVPPVLPGAERLGEIITALRQSAQSLLQIKSGAPLDAVPPDEGFTKSLVAFEALRTSLANYNAAVAAVNVTIEARKRATQATNVREVENAVAKLKGQKNRYTVGVQELCATETRLQGEKKILENEKALVRGQLDTHTGQVITQYGQIINRFLERINAGFRITVPSHNYRGGTPSTSYQILINQNAIDSWRRSDADRQTELQEHFECWRQKHIGSRIFSGTT